MTDRIVEVYIGEGSTDSPEVITVERVVSIDPFSPDDRLTIEKRDGKAEFQKDTLIGWETTEMEA